MNGKRQPSQPKRGARIPGGEAGGTSAARARSRRARATWLPVAALAVVVAVIGASGAVAAPPGPNPGARPAPGTPDAAKAPTANTPNLTDDVISLTGGATSGSVNVLANDSDPEGDPFTVTGWTNGNFGTVECVAAGTCTYTGDPTFTGADLFTYDVTDSTGASSSAQVTVCTSDNASPASLANAIATDAGTVTGASYVTVPGCGKPNAVYNSVLAGFPTASSTFAILTSGDADLANTPNTSDSSGADIAGPNIRGNTDFDVTVLKIDLNVPTGRNCLTFDFRFLSDEFPEFVGTTFNDAFIAELGTSTWSTSGSTISAPNNFASSTSSIRWCTSTTRQAGTTTTRPCFALSLMGTSTP